MLRVNVPAVDVGARQQCIPALSVFTLPPARMQPSVLLAARCLQSTPTCCAAPAPPCYRLPCYLPAAEFSTTFAGQVKELDCEGYVLKKWERRIDGVMKYMQVQALSWRQLAAACGAGRPSGGFSRCLHDKVACYCCNWRPHYPSYTSYLTV
jgi:hypothetical protein